MKPLQILPVLSVLLLLVATAVWAQPYASSIKNVTFSGTQVFSRSLCKCSLPPEDVPGNPHPLDGVRIARIVAADPDYAEAFEIARMRGVDVLEAEAVRRAHEGVTKPIFHGGKRAIDVVQNPDGSIKRDAAGKPIGISAAVREYSDTLLIFMLKGPGQ